MNYYNVVVSIEVTVQADDEDEAWERAALRVIPEGGWFHIHSTDVVSTTPGDIRDVPKD